MKMDIIHRCVECENDFDLSLYFHAGRNMFYRNDDALEPEASCEPRSCPFCDKEVDAYALVYEN